MAAKIDNITKVKAAVLDIMFDKVCVELQLTSSMPVLIKNATQVRVSLGRLSGHPLTSP